MAATGQDEGVIRDGHCLQGLSICPEGFFFFFVFYVDSQPQIRLKAGMFWKDMLKQAVLSSGPGCLPSLLRPGNPVSGGTAESVWRPSCACW